MTARSHSRDRRRDKRRAVEARWKRERKHVHRKERRPRKRRKTQEDDQ